MHAFMARCTDVEHWGLESLAVHACWNKAAVGREQVCGPLIFHRRQAHSAGTPSRHE